MVFNDAPLDEIQPKHIRGYLDNGCIKVKQHKTQVKRRIRYLEDDGKLNELGLLLEEILEFRRTTGTKARQLIVNERGEPLGSDAIRFRFDHAREAARKKLKASNRADKAREVAKFQMRDLRAKSPTDVADSISMKQAKDLLGHRNMATTEIYVRDRTGMEVSPTRQRSQPKKSMENDRIAEQIKELRSGENDVRLT